VNRARVCGAIELVVSPAHTFADIAWRKSNGPRVHGYVRIFDWLVAAKRLPCPAGRAGGCELFPRDDDGRAVSEAVLLHLMLTATLDARMIRFTGLLDGRLG
jgi:hypothetical protein